MAYNPFVSCPEKIGHRQRVRPQGHHGAADKVGRSPSLETTVKLSYLPKAEVGENRRERGATNGKEKQDADGDIKVGSTVPDFILPGVDGLTHKLSDFRGTKVMLCFYRYSFCPACAYTIGKLMGQFKKLAWASKLMVITVFRTDVAYLNKGLAGSDAPIRRNTGVFMNSYPFLALADPDGEAASTFKVDRKGSMKVISFLNAVITPSIFREIYLNGVKGGDTLLPSEFLIDENGVLVDILRAKSKRETMRMERISHFLLFGAQHPPTRNTI